MERSSSSDGRPRKIDRMAREARELGDAVAEWLELRIALVRAEVEEEVNRRLNEAIRRAIVLAIGGMAGLFVLVTLALGLGWWLGHPVWGFAVVAALLLIGALSVAYAYPERKVVTLEVPDSGPEGEGSGGISPETAAEEAGSS